MSTKRRCYWKLVCVFLLTGMLLGCNDGPRVYPVQGKVVSKDGIAPRFGTIEFRSLTDGTVASGIIANDGSFSLTTKTPNDGALVGEHEVILVRFVNVEDGPIHTHGHAVEIPKRYASFSTSDLRATVKASKENPITITFDADE